MTDTHCHIDLYGDPLATAKQAERRGITVIAMTNLPSHFETGYPRLLQFRRIRSALGLHPLMAREHKRERRMFLRLLAQTSYIGEIGLDFSRAGRDTREIQLESLRFVLEHISDRPRFVSLHSRGAESVVLQLLDEFGMQGAVFHWYSGPLKVLEKAIHAGHYFSVNPAMVRSKKGMEIIKRIPREQLLTESDGPYVQVKELPAFPSDVASVLRALQRIWGASSQEAEEQIETNFREITGRIQRYVAASKDK